MANEGVTRREAGLIVARLALGAAGLAVVGSLVKAKQPERKLCFNEWPDTTVHYYGTECEGDSLTNDPRLVTCAACLWYRMYSMLPHDARDRLRKSGDVVSCVFLDKGVRYIPESVRRPVDGLVVMVSDKNLVVSWMREWSVKAEYIKEYLVGCVPVFDQARWLGLTS